MTTISIVLLDWHVYISKGAWGSTNLEECYVCAQVEEEHGIHFHA
jgi:hypothetical protein